MLSHRRQRGRDIEDIGMSVMVPVDTALRSFGLRFVRHHLPGLACEVP